MKRYALLVAALMVLVGALGLPPRTYTLPIWSRTERQTPERSRFLELQNEMLREMWLYQRIQWRDSISEALGNLDPAETPFLLRVPDGSSGELLARLDAGVTRHLASLDALPPKVPVGVFLIPKAAMSHPAAHNDRLGAAWSEREFYVGRNPGKPFCALVEPVGEIGVQTPDNVIRRLVYLPQDPMEKPNTLRICGYYARYGVPGDGIESWLRDGGSLFASGVNQSWASIFGSPAGGNPRGPFGLWTDYMGISITGMACLAGVDTACRRVFLEPGRRQGGWLPASWYIQAQVKDSPVDFSGTRFQPYGRDFGDFDPFLMESLEEEFGPERFQEFWSSSLPVAEAFTSAFGTPLETWVLGWARARFASIPRGPGVPIGATLLSLLTLGILMGGAVHLGRRRA